MIEFKRYTREYLLISKLLTLVVAMGLVLCGCFSKSNNSNIKEIKKVVYPEAFAFDDFEMLRMIEEENPLDGDFLNALDEFAYRTTSLLLLDVKKNANYSPLSFYYALALVTSGAVDDTAEELLSLLGVNDIETLSIQCSNLFRLLYRDNDIGKLKIANSLWLDNKVNGKDIEFEEWFINNAVDNFYASLYNVDFSNPNTAYLMSEWVKNNTRGLIKPEFKPNPKQVVSIINTIYFLDSWVKGFDNNAVTHDKFYLSDDNTVMVDYMNQLAGTVPVFVGDGFIRASLPMINGNQMVFILPDKDVSLSEIFSSSNKLRTVFTSGQMTQSDIKWTLPKFSFNSSFNLLDLLKSLNVNQPFNNNANFSGITNHPIFISSVKQETYISVDTEGVEAAAYTKIDCEETSVGPIKPQINIILNRPFIYGIKAANGSLLFIGIVNNPAE